MLVALRSLRHRKSSWVYVELVLFSEQSDIIQAVTMAQAFYTVAVGVSQLAQNLRIPEEGDTFATWSDLREVFNT